MCNLLLADEINRTSPKTQAALLEVMEEGRVTVDGVTRQVPKPFTVIATQNPFGSSGTQRLPQSQLDRFLVRLSMGYPDKQSEINILKGKGISGMEQVNPVLTKESLTDLQKKTSEIFVKDEIYAFIADIAHLTRNSELFAMGISPRGSLAILRLARAGALMDDRDYVVPEDVLDVIESCVCHRVELSDRARAMHYTESDAIEETLKGIKMPK
jgi:MoxR-like ATPase